MQTKMVKHLRKYAKNSWSFIIHVFREWRADGTIRLGAGLAYYGVIALLPYLFVTVFVALLVFYPKDVFAVIADFLDTLFDGQGVNTDALRDAETTTAQVSGGSNVSVGLIGFGGFIITASLFIAALQDALNVIWKASDKVKFSITKYAVAFVVMLAGSVAFSLFLGVTVVISVLKNTVNTDGLVANSFFEGLSVLSIFLVGTLLFMLLYQVLIKVKIHWKSLVVSSAMTCVFMLVGVYSLSIYFSNFVNFSYYGALSTFFLLLLAMYYFAQIFLIGAQASKVISYRNGNKHLQPFLSKTDPRKNSK